MNQHATFEHRQVLRYKAAELFNQGLSNAEIARQLGLARPTVSRWHTLWERGGVAGLKIGITGYAARLSGQQWQQVVDALLEGPKAHGYDTELWTLARIAGVIEKTTGVRYSTNYVWELMGKIGWSCQKPEMRAKERDEDAIKHWKEHTWPGIKKGPRKRARP
jgi:transposase